MHIKTVRASTGYLLPVLQALDISLDSQLLVFSKTGVQRALTSPRTPRALYFDDSVAVGYVPGAPFIELASQDREQGIVFYTLDQTGGNPQFVRRTSCLSCHMSEATMDVPGMIVRSHSVDDEGNVLPQFPSRDVNHETPHSERWGAGKYKHLSIADRRAVLEILIDTKADFPRVD